MSKMAIGEKKTFENDLELIRCMLTKKKNFSFVRFGDGELRIMQDQEIDISAKANKEFKYDPGDIQDRELRQKLIAAFKYAAENYIVGIGCPCCVGTRHFNWMRTYSGKGDDSLTWANLFVNSNYTRYQEEVIPLYRDFDIVLVCNRNASLSGLPFKVTKDFRVGTNAWRESYFVLDAMKEYAAAECATGQLFLFCAGPFGNILAHQLSREKPDNTFMNVGSTLDPLLFGVRGRTRGYLRRGRTFNKTCIWG